MSSRAVKSVRKLLGMRLRILRKHQELSQERLGERADLSGKFIGEVERGEKSISVDSLYRVATALGVTLRDLTDFDPQKYVQKDILQAREMVFAFVRSLPPAKIEGARAVLEALFKR